MYFQHFLFSFIPPFLRLGLGHYSSIDSKTDFDSSDVSGPAAAVTLAASVCSDLALFSRKKLNVFLATASFPPFPNASYGLFTRWMHQRTKEAFDQSARESDSQGSIDLHLCLFQGLEVSMKDRKKDLEDLLAHSIELQRRQQLTPQEKVLIRI